ncbi:MAG: hypothetical protein DIZ80_05360 [endosymbiont of Galathealinum brachiosum]|uniref:Uncharacterized protein n=1 Tax=endosymbiont of Galathealinum brachiosum TaxID=2200906 RepID=A0A370DKI0_9GAMM|nr:MAG: hypothetical protein DIZ80_05360 [endosymbiont of Galathealinum brachiosum]
MTDLENNIPTLTDISHPGNDDMLNHFDAHQFDEQPEETESLFTLENASESENKSEPENTVIDDIPSIKIDDENTTDMDSQDFSEAMQSIANKAIENELDSNDLKEKIDQAINNAIPGITLQLKEQLYKQFNI